MPKKTVFVLSLIFLTVRLTSGAEVLRTAVVTKAVENMYSGPDDTVNVVSQALLGTNVKILASDKNAKGEEWFRIETPDTYEGWIVGTSLRLMSEGQKAYASEGTVFEVTSLLANIYSTDNVTKRKPLTVAPIGVCLEAGNCGEIWCEIKLPCGTMAWVQKGDGEIRDAASPRKKLLPDETAALAKRFLGLPYYWGGSSPYGFDCSGYVQLLYRLSGIDILRDAGIQMTKSGLAEVPAGQETDPRSHLLR